MTKKAIEVDANNAHKIRVGSLITQGIITGKVKSKEKVEQPFFNMYYFTIESGEIIKVLHSTL